MSIFKESSLLKNWEPHDRFTPSTSSRVAKLSLNSHFPNSKTPGKQENYSVKTFCSHQIWQIYITKGFVTIIFLFSRSLQVWKMRIEWQFCHLRQSRGGKFVDRFSIFQTRWLHENGNLQWKSPSNLSNECNKIIFLIFRFLGKWASRVENRSHDLSSNNNSIWK